QRPDLEDAGSELIENNHPLQEMLSMHGATMLHLENPLVHEMPEAREQIRNDKQDPVSALENWLALLTQPP
ncbi:MAG TPA: hypothetical protein VEQ17_07315, partial [Steroidobacteraceae bacterium]|nr:hypothetical protein [Steroidobacteraceae bacterium]